MSNSFVVAVSGSCFKWARSKGIRKEICMGLKNVVADWSKLWPGRAQLTLGELKREAGSFHGGQAREGQLGETECRRAKCRGCKARRTCLNWGCIIISCVTLGKLLKHSELEFPDQSNGEKRIYLQGLPGDLAEVISLSTWKTVGCPSALPPFCLYFFHSRNTYWTCARCCQCPIRVPMDPFVIFVPLTPWSQHLCLFVKGLPSSCQNPLCLKN